jgi:type I restriction enzyme M protein
MLDTDTKRRIDTARDILVGKVPDPKSQVEQITIALIYKFMDDMDAESEEFGGKRKFFANEFARYGWAKLMRSGLGGHEVLDLYVEGTRKMPENPGLPPLFRNIFKKYYLPYNDPETLKMFLKVIDEFNYDHSERLGDAFEYLLLVLGSQGDAGQFRTPRHIIDFMVEIIDPKKTETVLDPACGTAGFLISSYKHILKANTDVKGNCNMTPDEKGRLAQNFKGYDISPDMVRLSLVNMYLHGFADPHIYEYDTLTSQERWNEFADVILANPPFMSPKGGIKPHNRFSVQSKRSEVLFVDYMAEHLTPNGRAGIIVPEGIIFQGQSACRQLRKVLVEECLVAVVSLPAGVFNPYSGVKTSILILDKSLAKKTGTIAFFKIENDGFGLGAQRREIDNNDMPQALDEIGKYLCHLRAGESVQDLQPIFGLIVKKEKIAENSEYNLSGERYREGATRTTSFPHVRLDSIAEIAAGNSAPQGDEYFKGGRFPFIRTSDVGEVHFSDNFIGTTDRLNQRAIDKFRLRLFPAGTILLPKSGASTFLNHRVVMGEPAYVSSHLACIICNEKIALPKYVYSLLRQVDARRITSDQNYPSLRLTEIGNIEIPLPPLGIQKEIMAEVECYQNIINGAQSILENYRPHISIHSDWPEMILGEVCRFIDYRGRTPKKTNTGIPLITAKNVREGYIDPEPREYIAETDYDGWMTRGIPKVGDVLFTTEAPLGNVAVITSKKRFALAQRLIALCPNRKLLIGAFLRDVLLSKQIRGRIFANQSGTTVYGIRASVLKEIKVPVPSIQIQQALVSEIEVEQELVRANHELVSRFEKKIQSTLDRIWSENDAK